MDKKKGGFIPSESVSSELASFSPDRNELVIDSSVDTEVELDMINIGGRMIQSVHWPTACTHMSVLREPVRWLPATS